MRQVLVGGIGSTAFGRQPGIDIQDLAVLAADAAIRDSGLNRAEVGALYLGNFVSGVLTGQEVLAGMVADGLGLGQVPCTKVEGACASGGIAFRHAWLAVASGQCDVALAVGVEKMSHADTPTTTAALNCAMDNRSDGESGLTFPGLFGLAWHRHAELYGTTRAQVSAVVRKNKGNGLLNPLAHMGADVDDGQIMQSAMICVPLRLFDCCPVSDGAAAVLLVAADRRHDLVHVPDRRCCRRPDARQRAYRWACRFVFLRGHRAGRPARLRAGGPRAVGIWISSSCTIASPLPRSLTLKTSGSCRADEAVPMRPRVVRRLTATGRSTPRVACCRKAIRSAPPALARSSRSSGNCAANTRTRSATRRRG